MFRYNNPDALLVLLMVTAAYFLMRAISGASWRWLVLVGVALGLAFLTKMLAGLMVLPILFSLSMDAHADHAAGAQSWTSAWLAVGVHTVGYLMVTVLVAAVVYEKVGLAVLRRAWVNVDLIWAGALVVSGLLTLIL